MKSSTYVAAVAALAGGAFSTSSVEAEVTTPSGVAPGGTFRMIFVSEYEADAISANAGVYDSQLQAEAEDEDEMKDLGTYNGDAVIWKTLASFAGGDDAATRLGNANTPIFRLDGTKLADNPADLWDGIDVAPNMDSNGDLVTGDSAVVWTGSNNDGSPYTFVAPGPTLFTKSLGNSSVALGNASTAGSWMSPGFNGNPNSDLHHFYAFSNVLTASVPEPAAASLMLLGVGALAMKRRNRNA